MSAPDGPTEENWRRRGLFLLLVAALVVLGAGVGSLLLGGPFAPGGDNGATPTPTVTATETPVGSPTPEDGGLPTGTDVPTPTPSESDTPTGTPTATPAESPGDDDDDRSSDGAPTPSPGLELGDDGPLMSAANLHPNESGRGTLTLRNAADEDGNLTISAIAIHDAENGLTDPERDVDSTADVGELSAHLEVRLAIRDGAGDEDFLLGTDAGYVRLAELPDRTPSANYSLASGEDVTLVADWRLPRTAGNEVQSDGVRVDLGLSLVGTNG